MTGLERRSDVLIESVSDRVGLIAAVNIKPCIGVELLRLIAKGSDLDRSAVYDFTKNL